MSIKSLIIKLRNLNINLSISDSKIIIDAPKGRVSEDMLLIIKRNKEEIISYLNNIKSQEKFYSIQKAQKQSNYLLSSAQKRLYLLQKMDLDSTAYNTPYIIPLGKESDKLKIEEVFHQLISRHESFRTSFEIEGEDPIQRIHEQVDFKIEEFAIEKSEKYKVRQDFIQVFDLTNAPLLRVAIVEIKGEDSLLMIDTHHIISDGTSHKILEKEFQALLSGEELPALKLQYKDYSEWQKSKEQQLKVKGQEDYWLRKFEGEIPVLNLPTDYVRPVMQSHEGARVSFTLSKKETKGIKLLAKENDLTLYMSVLSVFSILLSKLSGQEDIIVGTPIEGRRHIDLEKIVGMFVNTLPIRNEIKGSDTLQELIGRLKQTTIEAYENQDCQFEDLVEQVSVERDISRNPLFDVMFNLLNHTEYTGDLSGLTADEYVHEPGVSKFDLTLTAVDYGEQLLLSFEYCTKLFKAETIERFINYFKQLVNQLPGKLEEKLSRLEIITELEKQELLYAFNDTKADYPRDKTIHQLFEEQVQKTPDNIAVFTKDKTITYKELQTMSESLAKIIQSKVVSSESVVGLMVDRSIEMIVGIMGILRAGCCYLPIMPNTPKSRLEHFISDSESPLLLTQTKYQEKLTDIVECINLENLESISYSHQDLPEQNKPTRLAYIIYTSGSTGNPKGVMIENHSVINRIKWMQKQYPIGLGDTILQKTPYTFDVSVWELFWWSFEGASVYMLEPEGEKDPQLISRTIEEKKINVIHFVPSMLETFLNIIEADSSKYNLESLKYVFSSGESLKAQQVKSFYKLFLNNVNTQLINLYGPTEATVYVSFFDCLRDIEYRNIPIGKPIDNTQLYILDKDTLQLQAIGVAGELMISGEGLSRGYIKQEKLTVEKFIDHPFKKGDRLYRTGDLARWLPDGNIEFLGRIDHQVKIRGFRIELGEIENALLKHERIKESVVLAREENGDKYLCAYLVKEEEIDQEEIRAYLSSSLPDYMVPFYFIELDSLPLTSNGKVNRKALPPPEVKAGEDYVAPSNKTEEKLLEIWSEILNIALKEISTNVSFFELGGHSLKATVLVSRIHKELGVRIGLRDIFKYPRIKEFSKLIEAKEKTEYVEIENIEKKEYYEVTNNQARLWFLNKLDDKSTAYNIGDVISLGLNPSFENIMRAIKKLLQVNESLRTGFKTVNGKPVQFIYYMDRIDVEYIIYDLRNENDLHKRLIEFVNYEFDFNKPPLVKFIIFRNDDGNTELGYIMHHIITDGWSLGILKKEFFKYYNKKEDEINFKKRFSYIDYTIWLQQFIFNKKEQSREFWMQLLNSPIESGGLPKDFDNITNKKSGSILLKYLNKDQNSRIQTLSKILNTSTFTIMFTAYLYLLKRVTGTKRPSSFIINAGRNHYSTFSIVGFFVNAVLFNTEIDEDLSFKNFINNLHDRIAQAFDYQYFPIEDLLEEMRMKYPEVPVAFNMLNMDEKVSGDGLMKNEKRDEFSMEVKFDIELYVKEYEEEVVLSFVYNKNLFQKETIQFIANTYNEILNYLLEKTDNSYLDYLKSKKKIKIF